jgi:hypothetical protein
MRRKRGILTYVCVASLALSGASASLGADESYAPVVEPSPAADVTAVPTGKR